MVSPKKWIKRDSFFTGVSVLAGGTAIAQAVTLLALPIATRFYTPEDFSLLAAFAGLLVIISVPACLRFDVAIPVPESDRDAANLLALALLSLTLVTAAVVVAVLLQAENLGKLLQNASIANYAWLIPIGIFQAGAYNAFLFWAVRKKTFKAVSSTRLIQAFSGAGTQIGLGWSGVGAVGLLIGQIANSGAGTFRLLRHTIKGSGSDLLSIRLPEMRRLFGEFKRYPMVSTFEALANSASFHLPILVIAATAARSEAGYLFLALRLTQVPASLVSGAVSQVYQSDASIRYRTGDLGLFTIQVVGRLIRIGVGPLIVLGILAPTAFGLVLGTEWQPAGRLVSWLIPSVIAQFLTAPVAIALNVTNNQATALGLQVYGLILRVSCVVAAGSWIPDRIAEVYAVSGAVFYTSFLVVLMYTLSVDARAMLRECKRSAATIAFWVCPAMFLLALFEYASRA